MESGKRYLEMAHFQRVSGGGMVVFAGCVTKSDEEEQQAKIIAILSAQNASKKQCRQTIGVQAPGPILRQFLEAVNNQYWLSSFRIPHRNQIAQFDETSPRRTKDSIHVRFNTHQKVLPTLWTIWKHDAAFDS